MSNWAPSMSSIGPRWIRVLALYLGLLAGGYAMLDGASSAPAATDLMRQTRSPPVSAEVAALFAELDAAQDESKGADCGTDDRRSQAQAKLAALGPQVIPALLHRLVHAPEDRAGLVAGVFHFMRQRARPAIPSLLVLLEQAPLQVRHRAVESLLEIWPLDPPVLDALVELYEDDGQARSLQDAAGFAIVHGSSEEAEGADVADTIAALRMLLDAKDPRLRVDAVHALGGIRPVTSEVFEGLTDALGSRRLNVRDAAAAELDKLKGLAADPAGLSGMQRSVRAQ